MFQTRCYNVSNTFANVQNTFIIFKTRCQCFKCVKCFKRVANIQNVLRIFAPPYIPNALLIPEKNNMWQVSATVLYVCVCPMESGAYSRQRQAYLVALVRYGIEAQLSSPHANFITSGHDSSQTCL